MTDILKTEQRLSIITFRWKHSSVQLKQQVKAMYVCMYAFMHVCMGEIDDDDDAPQTHTHTYYYWLFWSEPTRRGQTCECLFLLQLKLTQWERVVLFCILFDSNSPTSQLVPNNNHKFASFFLSSSKSLSFQTQGTICSDIQMQQSDGDGISILIMSLEP